MGGCTGVLMRMEGGGVQQWGGGGSSAVGGNSGGRAGSTVRVSSTSKNRPSHHKDKSTKQF